MFFKMLKKSMVIICCLIIVFSFGYRVFADGAASVIDGAYKGDTTTKADSAAKKIITSVLSVVRSVAAAIAIIILIVIACKYILASAGDRADIKKYAFNYIIGAIILFSASALIGIVRDAVKGALGE